MRWKRAGRDHIPLPVDQGSASIDEEVAAHSPIRIVPLWSEALAPIAAPRLTYRGGPLLASPQVFLFFWGDVWQSEPLATQMKQLTDFFDYVLTSPLMDQLAEYDLPNYTIGHGVRSGDIVVTVAPPSSVADADVRQLIRGQLASNRALPQITPSSLYFVYLPPGVTSQLDGSSSCVTFCGYHDSDGDLYYAVMPHPDCAGCTAGMTAIDSLTTTSSHELCEAITDPVPGKGYYDDANGEIGDICAFRTKKLGAYTVQLEWSNTKGACV